MPQGDIRSRHDDCLSEPPELTVRQRGPGVLSMAADRRSTVCNQRLLRARLAAPGRHSDVAARSMYEHKESLSLGVVWNESVGPASIQTSRAPCRRSCTVAPRITLNGTE